MIWLYNTLTRKKEEFKPIKDGFVGMYNCGPTVYNYAHIGNLRAYVFADILKRMFRIHGYSVKQVINITDVGHLTSDADEGEDKLEKGARRENKSAKEIADFYTSKFMEDLSLLNVDTNGTIFPKATDHIKEQIALIGALEEKGFTYQTNDGVYFDTAQFPEYGNLARLDVDHLQEGARIEKNVEKKNLTDFALWKFSPPDEKREQEWESPWGVGFPGWHLECSAMSMKYLGEHFDIHTGGIDHIPIHHTNEIAQSQCATGHQFVNYWMHTGFVNIDGGRMAKSEENFITLATLTEKGFDPLSYRYWLLTADYKKTINFTWEALAGAQTALEDLIWRMKKLESADDNGETKDFKKTVTEMLSDDLNTAKVIALFGDSNITRGNLELCNTVLGLGFDKLKKRIFENIPEDIINSHKKREDLRIQKKWKEADKIRKELEEKGYVIRDLEIRGIIGRKIAMIE